MMVARFVVANIHDRRSNLLPERWARQDRGGSSSVLAPSTSWRRLTDALRPDRQSGRGDEEGRVVKGAMGSGRRRRLRLHRHAVLGVGPSSSAMFPAGTPIIR